MLAVKMFAFVFDYLPISSSISLTSIYLRTCHLPKAMLVLWPQEKGKTTSLEKTETMKA